MKAYQSLKNNYSDCILFFRLGDEYVAFFEDAEAVSIACDLPVEHRGPAGDDVPVVSLDELMFKVHLNKLLRAGYKVLTREQISGRDIIRTFLPDKTKVG